MKAALHGGRVEGSLIAELGGPRSSPNRAPKRIQAVVEKGPNYIFHLMAVARAGFASPYAETYRFSVEPEDLKLLERWRARLVTADGTTIGGRAGHESRTTA